MGVSLPEELKRSEDRLAAMAAAKAKLVARAEERDQREKAEYDEKMARRAARGYRQEARWQAPQGSRALTTRP